MLIKFFELPLLKVVEGGITGSIFVGKESRLKTDNFPISLFFDL
jgi:hypothetical protein